MVMEDERDEHLTRYKGFRRSNALLLSNKNQKKKRLLINKLLNEEAQRTETLALNFCPLARGFEPVCVLALSPQSRHGSFVGKTLEMSTLKCHLTSRDFKMGF